MDATTLAEAAKIKPTLVERARGLGWLALSPRLAPLQLGVEGPTEKEAQENFDVELARWIRALGADLP